ncbi:hypothetical protein FXO38_07099 [Capsicum annuum]|uniref:Uncharacterized protein n=1 Tax=Capsicum annuum TaxID=4072 RepID=A0A2G3ANY0_CAPAN|nr:hypothetical protein FXO38_07099 [Capsicum annuum]PHT95920.1 hypothetical protein T459_03802 [Capsicum annuum]
MDIHFNVVGGFVVEVGKFISKCVYPKIESIIRFSSKIENLRKEMEKLAKFRDAIKDKVEGAEGEGYKPKLDVIEWIEDVRSWRNNGNLCKIPLQQLRHLCINAVQNADFAQKSPLKGKTSKINFEGL